MHRAKGLEFRAVAVVAVGDGALPLEMPGLWKGWKTKVRLPTFPLPRFLSLRRKRPASGGLRPPPLTPTAVTGENFARQVARHCTRLCP